MKTVTIAAPMGKTSITRSDLKALEDKIKAALSEFCDKHDIKADTWDVQWAKETNTGGDHVQVDVTVGSGKTSWVGSIGLV